MACSFEEYNKVNTRRGSAEQNMRIAVAILAALPGLQGASVDDLQKLLKQASVAEAASDRIDLVYALDPAGDDGRATHGPKEVRERARQVLGKSTTGRPVRSFPPIPIYA
jgi:hypothetical protein